MKKALVAITLFISSLANAETLQYNVEGMHCGGCVKAIKSQVCKLEGVQSCEVSVGSLKLTTKEGVKFTNEQIQEAVTKAGEYTIKAVEKK